MAKREMPRESGTPGVGSDGRGRIGGLMRRPTNRRIVVSRFGGPEAAFIVLAFTLPGSKRIRPFSIQALMRRKPQWFRRDLGTLFQLLTERKIAPMIATKFALTEAASAHRILARGDVVGKIVLDCTAEAA
jgi:NADPH:quinone reductase-like Zn-dependent oxidoreductase